jgi:CubicO group peptidase (beta-lactamase class C family)
MSMAGLPLGHFRSNEGILELLARQKGLNFAPGAQYSYSNSGYLLLGEIVERVSGKSLRKFAEERIFAPLGMRATRFHDDYMELIPDRASGYLRTPRRGYRNFISAFDRVGSGGVFSTVEDLVLWDRELEEGKVLSPEVRALMHTRGVLTSGETLDYAFGLVIGRYRGLPTVSHAGALGGYRSAILRFPKQRLTVIILANVDAMNPMRLCHEIALVYLADELGEEPEEPEEPEGSARSPRSPRSVGRCPRSAARRSGPTWRRRLQAAGGATNSGSR